MKLYAVSTKYLPLVTVNVQPLPGSKVVSKKNISIADLQTTFDNSKSDALIAFEDKNKAIQLAYLLLKPHNTLPDFIQEGVNLFRNSRY